jgi:hypothetical protein
MTYHRWRTLALAALVFATAAEAGPRDSNKGKGNDGASLHCPPGLAKKNPPCIPPGHAGKNAPAARIDPAVTIDRNSAGEVRLYDDYTVGALLPDDHVILFDPLLYPDWPRAAYARYGDFIYLIDPVTGLILDRAVPVADWNWSWSGVDFANCPPGLAKKNPPCIPPGQARQGMIIGEGPYAIGTRLPEGFRVIIDPRHYAEGGSSLYARLGDSLYRVDRRTGLVLDLIGNLASLLDG